MRVPRQIMSSISNATDLKNPGENSVNTARSSSASRNRFFCIEEARMPLLRSRSWTFVLLIALAGCVTNAGESAYNRGGFREAYNLWRPLAAAGDPIAQYSLGVLYSDGDGVARDYVAAENWWRKSAEDGLAQAQHNLALVYANGAGVPRNYPEAVKWFRKAAETIPRSKFNLGTLYAKGLGVPQDWAVAKNWYEKAAADGVADAHMNLGVIYEKGQGVAIDKARAANSFERAIELYNEVTGRGRGLSLYRAALMYSAGRGVPKDIEKAVAMIQKAAEIGNAKAQFLLGTMHFRGEAVEKSTELGLKFWNLAAAQAHPDAQLDLGMLYSRGDLVPQNHINAMAFWGQAATGGSVQAMHNLGWAFDNGTGVSHDHAEAVKWYLRAAEQGNAASRYNLAKLIEKGEGVTKDNVEALKWHNLAVTATRSEEKRPVMAKARDALKAKMTAEDIAKAERLALEWKPNQRRWEEAKNGVLQEKLEALSGRYTTAGGRSQWDIRFQVNRFEARFLRDGRRTLLYAGTVIGTYIYGRVFLGLSSFCRQLSAPPLFGSVDLLRKSFEISWADYDIVQMSKHRKCVPITTQRKWTQKDRQ